MGELLLDLQLLLDLGCVLELLVDLGCVLELLVDLGQLHVQPIACGQLGGQLNVQLVTYIRFNMERFL